MGLAQIKMPQLGESVTEGTVEKWLKSEGDFVKRDEPLVEVVTDKVNAEIPSPFEGKLVKISAAEGETVRVGAVIGADRGCRGRGPLLLPHPPSTGGSTPPEVPAAPAPRAPRQRLPQQRLRQRLAAACRAGGDGGTSALGSPRPCASWRRSTASTPAAFTGTGMGGRVTRDDVLAAVESGGAAAAPAKAPAPARLQRRGRRASTVPAKRLVKLSSMRKAIAEHMVRSLATSPHAWTMQEVDVTNLVRYREAEKEGFRSRHGVPLTYLPFVVQIVCDAHQAVPVAQLHVEPTMESSSRTTSTWASRSRSRTA